MHGSRARVARIGLLVLVPALAALAVEGAASLAPASAPTSSESLLFWVAGARPAFDCGTDGICRVDPGLAAQSNRVPSFTAVPAPGAFRVACVGDSTTAGWPYHPRGGYPEWLGAVLRDVLPGRRSEVLNLGVHAWDGARLESVFDQALSFHPDVVVLRLGYDDYWYFLLRRPRGGTIRRAAQQGSLFLLARSAAFRRLFRTFAPAMRRGDGDGPVVLTEAEETALIAAHRARLRALAARARRAGIGLVILGLPHLQDRGFPGTRALDGEEAATAEEARTLGAAFVPLDEFKTRERFTDMIHSDLEGYRLTALDVARALAAAGLGAPRERWRWDLLEPPGEMRRRLGLDEPEYRAHLETALARAAFGRGDRQAAGKHLESALLAAPNADMVPEEERLDAPEMKSLYRETFARLAKEKRVPPPLESEHRIMAGL